MYNVPMMAITEEREPESMNSMSPRSNLSAPICLDNNNLPVCPTNYTGYENGGQSDNQYQIKSLRRELPQIPNKKSSNFLTVDDPYDAENTSPA